MKIYHPKYKNIAILFCNKDDVIGHVKIDGMPVSSGDPGFSRELGEFCFFFRVDSTTFRVYFIRNGETFVVKTIFNRKYLPRHELNHE